MLLTSRAYQQSQSVASSLWSQKSIKAGSSQGWGDLPPQEALKARKMLLVHQAGSVKVGEVVRYTITYTPAHDRILPTPSQLYVRVKNSSAIPLRAAYLHGPYTLYVSCYPSTFDPNSKYDGSETYGNPQFEPLLKAGASWLAQLKIPEGLRETIASTDGKQSEDRPAPSVTWVIEVASQVLFSLGATVHYEVVVGRDEKSIDFGFAGLMGSANSVPGQLSDHQAHKKEKHHGHEVTGVFSRAISLRVEDTAMLWDKPELPHFTDDMGNPIVNPVLAETDPKAIKPEKIYDAAKQFGDKSKAKPKNKKRVHLVVITHGLHSNLGADMLFLKESIDEAARQAKLDRQMRRAKRRSKLSKESSRPSTAHEQADGPQAETTDTDQPDQPPLDDQEDEGEISGDEQVIVRGFAGNATKTERGIQFLGKRLAKYVLAITYPDQPYLPAKKVKSPLAKAFSSNSSNAEADVKQPPAHANSSIVKEETGTENLAYQITSISFIGHSLGGLTQTYAIAYIHKHSPEFFKRIRPLNFVSMASPFLGLSNENPIYVKFALDFGLVGRTGQDLGLTWRAPTIARNGWSAMIAGIGTEGQRKQRQNNPSAKPLLRILPAGPAHQVLRMFKNRTVYSNVVNDGVVPLRTSCLLFLDWRGLGRVEKARRGHGVIGTVANWGWAELTGTNASEYQKFKFWFDNDASPGENLDADDESMTPRTLENSKKVPQPPDSATEDDVDAADVSLPEAQQFLKPPEQPHGRHSRSNSSEKSLSPSASPLSGFMNLFKPGSSSSQQPKQKKIFRRGQTMDVKSDEESSTGPSSPDPHANDRPGMARGDSVHEDGSNVFTPPTTSIFESATDLLNPPIPSMEFITDPSSRPRTIFHDRVYHPDDIPPPPAKKRFSMRRMQSSEPSSTLSSRQSTLSVESGSSAGDGEVGSMKVEEKIARAYHRDLSWRKVLVRLEPDAHNNIVVRRMFANAYGWPVIKHLVDTHFADSYTARTADTNEANTERARPMDEPVDSEGEEVTARPKQIRRRASTGTSNHEAQDEITDLEDTIDTTAGTHSSRNNSKNKPKVTRLDSAVWDDRFFNTDSDDDEDDFEPQRSPQLLPSGSSGKTRTPDIIENNLDSKVKQRPPSIDVSGAKPVVASKLTSSPKNTTGIGLQKALDHQIQTSDKSHTGSSTTQP